MSVRENPYPYWVKGVDDLPADFQQVVQALLQSDDSIEIILMLPPQPYMKRGGIARQVLVSTARGLLRIEEGKPPVATYILAESLLYVHHTSILLYDRLEIVGEMDNKPVRLVAEYHTAGQDLLKTALRRFLRFSYDTLDADKTFADQNDAILENLSDRSFKFLNALQLDALQPGEQLLGYVFQPRISERLLRIFSRAIAPASLFALTSQAVILIEENKASGASYGWVMTLCPRKVVLAVESRPMQEWAKLAIILLKKNLNEERGLTVEKETSQTCVSLWQSQTAKENLMQ
jgi:hypothetical protein